MNSPRFNIPKFTIYGYSNGSCYVEKTMRYGIYYGPTTFRVYGRKQNAMPLALFCAVTSNSELVFEFPEVLRLGFLR